MSARLPSVTLTGPAAISPEDVHMLERLAGMDTPPRERLEFLGLAGPRLPPSCRH
jgi:hypothetical protein